MSVQMFDDDVRFLQRFLHCSEFDCGAIDGIYGPKTHRASVEFDDDCQATMRRLGGFDRRSEICIATLLPRMQVIARQFLARAIDAGYIVRIISGTRSYDEQHALYQRGRTTPGRRVTNALPGQSYHNFGLAFDVALFSPEGEYITYEGEYDVLAELILAAPALAKQLEWGGHWRQRKDRPHYQGAVKGNITAIRWRFEAGRAFEWV